MNKLREYFHTDWSAMTLHDWIGLIITVGAFLAMVWIYARVFNPKNKERYESQRHIPFEEENTDSENRQ